MEEKRLDEKGRLIQAVAHYCGTWPTGHYWPAYWDSVLDYKWRGKDGEAPVGREESLKLIFYINKNIRW